MQDRKAVCAVIGAGILWGVISLFIRPLSDAGLDPVQIAAVRMTTASGADVLLYTSPVFILLFSALLFHERITRIKLLALVLTFAGCVCVAGLTGGVRLSAIVMLAGVGSGLFYGLYTIFGRYALKRYDAVTVTAYSFLFASLGALVGMLVFHESRSAVKLVGIVLILTAIVLLNLPQKGHEGAKSELEKILSTP